MPIRMLKTSDMRGSKHKNTRRENRLEELGRVDAEKAYTSRGKRNLRDEKSRIRTEITDPQRKKDLRRKLKPLPTPPSRKLSPTDKEHMRRLLKTGRPKIAKKGWK